MTFSPLPTSTCWSSAPASPASTSSTALGRPASPCSSLEAGDGVGGTWFWNRYPGARFDSESYTYGYLFSKELFDEWEWQEHFAGQPEIERYLNHVVDRFDLRRHMRFGARVTSAVCDEASGTWAVTTDDGTTVTARFLVTATGVLSVPYLPDIPGATTSGASSTTPAGGRPSPSTSPASGWRSSAPRRAACRWCPPSSTRSPSLTVYQRVGQLVHAAEQPADHRRRAGRAAGRLRAAARGAEHLDPRVPPPDEHRDVPSTTHPRSGSAFFEEMWASPGFMKFTSNYVDILDEPRGERRVVRVHRRQDPRHRRRPRHRRAADPHGPPLRREAPALRHRLLRGVQPAERVARRPARHPDRAGDRDRHRDDRRRAGRTTSSCGPPGSTSAPVRCCGWGSAVATAWPSTDHWADGPTTFLGVQTARLPEPLLPGRAARRRRQQPPLQRRPGRLHHRHARPRSASTGSTSSRSPRRPRSGGRT